MLTPAWYLTDGDHYFGELPKVAQLDPVESAISAIAHLFSDEAEFGPEQTARPPPWPCSPLSTSTKRSPTTLGVTPWSSWPGCCTA